MQQLTLPGLVEKRGGKRVGAGRKQQGERKRVSRKKRGRVTRHRPLHVTLRVCEDIPYLRERKYLRLFETVLRAMKGMKGFRVIHFALLPDHVHLLVEGVDNAAVSRGMHSLGIRFAWALNRLLGRRGPVLADRYHTVALTCPRQVRSALRYVLSNARKHGVNLEQFLLDPFSSASLFPGWEGEALGLVHPIASQDIVSAPTCWLLREGWRKHGLISPTEVPGLG